jgi:hypothetical protein
LHQRGIRIPRGAATGGWYDVKKRTLEIDGGVGSTSAAQVYAHEFAHVIDGPDDELSQHVDWQNAWRAEIGTKDRPLSPYAASSPIEGFAELGRLIFGDKVDVARTFRKCFAFWKQRELV